MLPSRFTASLAGAWRAGPMLALALLVPAPLQADSPPRAGRAAAAPAPVPAQLPVPSYADLTDLADSAPLVVRAQVRKAAEVEPARAPGLRPGWARLYIEARTEAVLGGRTALGEAIRYLVDVPRDAKGKPPKLGKRSVVIFARPVAARPGELQLVAPDAQILWDPMLEDRVKAILAELYAPGAPLRVTGVREAIHVAGALAGEGETQFFLATAAGEPAAITVTRAAGAPPRWTVSFSEVVETDAPPPQRDSLTWYRLACFLPPLLPAGANVSGSPAERQAAGRDYRFVLDQLGPCARVRG